jgi:hypothetical protein
MSEEEHIMKENLVNEDVDKGIELSILFRMALTCNRATSVQQYTVGLPVSSVLLSSGAGLVLLFAIA